MIHSFQFQDQNVLLDVESGAIHTVDDAAFAIVQAIERGEDPEIALAATGVERQRHEAQANGLRSARGDSGTIARWLT